MIHLGANHRQPGYRGAATRYAEGGPADMLKSVVKISALCVVLGGRATPASAGGMFLPVRGVRALERAGAFTAGADDAGAGVVQGGGNGLENDHPGAGQGLGVQRQAAGPG